MPRKKARSEVEPTTTAPAHEAEKKRADQEYSQELALKVNFLFDRFRKPDGAKYTFSEVEQRTKGEVDQSWLWKLAHGQVSRPGLRVLKSISDFFGVDANFWFDELDETALTKVKEDVLALRVRKLTPEALQIVLGLIDSLENSGMDVLRKEKPQME